MESVEAYSRLVALSKLNVVPDYERIRSKTAIIIGVGGVGSVAAEMLVRSGIGRLVIFDYDKVEMANMNRMFFTPDQVGMLKVDAAKQSLDKISQGNTVVVPINGNICSVECYSLLLDTIRTERSAQDNRKSLLLCCVDNYAARVTVNQACLETTQIWLESGVAETALSGHIQLMVPGSSACFECAPPAIVATNGDEKRIVRPGVCAASLPTTMSIVAGLMVQSALKFFLTFGDIGGCLGYDALTDYFPSYDIKPSIDCANESCRSAQRSESSISERVFQIRAKETPHDSQISHESNEWGLEVVTENEVENPSNPQTQSSALGTLSVSDLIGRLKKN